MNSFSSGDRAHFKSKFLYFSIKIFEFRPKVQFLHFSAYSSYLEKHLIHRNNVCDYFCRESMIAILDIGFSTHKMDFFPKLPKQVVHWYQFSKKINSNFNFGPIFSKKKVTGVASLYILGISIPSYRCVIVLSSIEPIDQLNIWLKFLSWHRFVLIINLSAFWSFLLNFLPIFAPNVPKFPKSWILEKYFLKKVNWKQTKCVYLIQV
jgi:hypothetical protein